MTNARAAAEHRRLDAAQAEAMARDGHELVDQTGALMPPRQRRVLTDAGRDVARLLVHGAPE